MHSRINICILVIVGEFYVICDNATLRCIILLVKKKSLLCDEYHLYITRKVIRILHYLYQYFLFASIRQTNLFLKTGDKVEILQSRLSQVAH